VLLLQYPAFTALFLAPAGLSCLLRNGRPFLGREVLSPSVTALRASAQARGYLLRVLALNRFRVVLGDDLIQNRSGKLVRVFR
jgi:hypothetical protein